MVLASPLSPSLGVAALWLQGLGLWGRGACKKEAQKCPEMCESTHVAFAGTASRNMWSGSRYSVPHQQRRRQHSFMSEDEIVKRVLATFSALPSRLLVHLHEQMSYSRHAIWEYSRLNEAFR